MKAAMSMTTPIMYHSPFFMAMQLSNLFSSPKCLIFHSLKLQDKEDDTVYVYMEKRIRKNKPTNKQYRMHRPVAYNLDSGYMNSSSNTH